MHVYRSSATVIAWRQGADSAVAATARPGRHYDLRSRARRSRVSFSYGVATSGAAVTPGSGALTLTGFAPGVALTANQAMTPAGAALAVAGYAPTLNQFQGTSPGAGSITITAYAPGISQTGSLLLSPGPVSLAISGHVPSILQDGPREISIGVAALAFSGFQPDVVVSGELVSMEQAKQYLDMALGVALPDFVVQAAIEKASPYVPAMVDAGYSHSDQVMVLCISVALIAAAGMPRRLNNQSSPSGASRGFKYTDRDLWALRRSLAALDTAGVMTQVVGPDPTAVGLFMVV